MPRISLSKRLTKRNSCTSSWQITIGPFDVIEMSRNGIRFRSDDDEDLKS